MRKQARGSVSSRSRKLQPRQQVAAVCYRIRKSGVEFLLVQTSGGRWIFPKGGVEPGMTHAQSAAMEAFEEAGVHGRIERGPFARFHHRRPEAASSGSQSENTVTAHLCEVSRLERPQEPRRNPTWFSADKAKLRLQQERHPQLGDELARVVDRAASRIERLRLTSTLPREPKFGKREFVQTRKDALQEVCFEAADIVGARSLAWMGAYAQHIRRQLADLQSLQARATRSARKSGEAESLSARPLLRLTSGSVSREMLKNVRFIDEIRPAASHKVPAKSAKAR
jgi:8-oxo-dGTP pyrophosphatase MutT (NUDIX family)